ncbi:peptidase dimerization domain-containing protein [Mesorhizobium sp.]|uniref:peptidase dimerization domain-containing protein n=1 Tax=Mesorhizobium sp. TaxID=1871066 RepID=UPI00338FD592
MPTAIAPFSSSPPPSYAIERARPSFVRRSKIEGRGGHSGRPHKCIDSILVGAHLITALQEIVAQNVDPLERRGFRSMNSVPGSHRESFRKRQSCAAACAR